MALVELGWWMMCQRMYSRHLLERELLMISVKEMWVGRR